MVKNKLDVENTPAYNLTISVSDGDHVSSEPVKEMYFNFLILFFGNPLFVDLILLECGYHINI